MLILGKLDHVEEQPGEWGDDVRSHIVDFKGEHLLDRQGDPIEPSPVLVVDLRVARKFPFCRHFLEFRQIGSVFRGVNDGFPRPLRRCDDCGKVVHVRCEQVSKLPVVRTGFHEVEQVKRKRVLGFVVKTHDFRPVGRDLLHKCVVNLVMGLIYPISGIVKDLALLTALTDDAVRLRSRKHLRPELLNQLPFPPEIGVFSVFIIGKFGRSVGMVGQDVLIYFPKVEKRIRSNFQSVFHGTQGLFVVPGVDEHIRDLVLGVIHRQGGDSLYPSVLDIWVIPLISDPGDTGKRRNQTVCRKIPVPLREGVELLEYFRIATKLHGPQFLRKTHVYSPSLLLSVSNASSRRFTISESRYTLSFSFSKAMSA